MGVLQALLDNSLDHVHERFLRLIYDDFAHSFQEYLEMINQKKNISEKHRMSGKRNIKTFA